MSKVQPIDTAARDYGAGGIGRDLRCLDTLRGLAAFMVVVFHYEQPTHFAYVPSVEFLGLSLQTFVRHGYLNVDLFFILSGYILSHKYDRVVLKPTFNLRANRQLFLLYRSFLLKRVARCYPIYAFMTLIVLAIWTLEPIRTPDHWPSEMFSHPWSVICSNLTLTQAWGLAPSLNSPSWSLSAECFVYLCFPLVNGLALSRNRVVTGVLVLVVAAVIASSRDTPYGDAFDNHDFFDPRTILRALTGFWIGALVCRSEAVGSVLVLISHPLAFFGATAAVWVALAGHGLEWVCYPAFGLLVASASHVTNPLIRRILSSAVFQVGGLLSFCVYMIHDQTAAIRNLMETSFVFLHLPYSHLLSLGASLMVLYTISAVAFFGIERPARNYIICKAVVQKKRVERSILLS